MKVKYYPHFFKNSVIALFLLASASTAIAADIDLKQYIPNIHGAFRTRWELDTEHGENRFQVRNARVTLDGKIAPSISYFFQTDLCDAGKMKILDAYGKIGIVKGLEFKAGQFRMPFGIETFRAPANYIFANRSFMGKQIMNYRAVGAQLGYTLPKIPLTLEFGAFNPATIGDHSGWSKTVQYSGKATYRLSDFTISASYGSIRPYQYRANLIDGALVWNNREHWLVGAEYMYEKYCNKAARHVNSWLGFIDWHMPVKAGVFNQWSVQLREDGMTDHMTMDRANIEPGRNRLTAGTTLTYNHKVMHCDVRLNYEKYFYQHDYEAASGAGDKIVAELVIRF